MPKEPTSVCPFCFPFYPLSRRTLLPSRLKHRFRDNPRPALPPARTAVPQPGLPLGYPPCRWCLLRTVLPHAVIARCAAKPELPTGGSPSQQSKSKQTVPREQAEKPGNQKGTRCPADALFCFLGVSSHLGLIPGSGGFPECSAQHRTVRRRAAVKSAAEEAAHRRSKRRCPDQAGMPSVRWQWLYGAGH